MKTVELTDKELELLCDALGQVRDKSLEERCAWLRTKLSKILNPRFAKRSE